MQLKALTRSATGMTDGQCRSNKMAGLRGGRELTIMQAAKLPSSGRSWLGEWGRKVPATMDFYRGGLAFLSLRGAKRRSNLRGEPNEIATPRQVGAGNDKVAWCWMKEAATESWRRDLNLQVSSLVFGAMNRTTISACGAPSTGRVPVGRGQRTTPQMSSFTCEGLGWSKNKQNRISK